MACFGHVESTGLLRWLYFGGSARWVGQDNSHARRLSVFDNTQRLDWQIGIGAGLLIQSVCDRSQFLLRLRVRVLGSKEVRLLQVRVSVSLDLRGLKEVVLVLAHDGFLLDDEALGV